MTFARPEMLWSLLLLALVVGFHVRVRRRRVDHGTSWVVLALRVILFGALIAALARPVSTTERDAGVCVVVADVSDSVGDLEAVQRRVQRSVEETREAGAAVRVVVFAERARQLMAAARDDAAFSPVDRTGVGRTDRSDLGAALELAASLVPPGAGGVVSLVSDGRETTGLASDAIRRLAARTIPLDVHVVGPDAATPVMRPVAAPAAASVGETVTLTVRVDGATEATPLFARIEGPSGRGRRVRLPLGADGATATLAHEVVAPGVNELTVRVEGADGAVVDQRPVAICGLDAMNVHLIESRDAPTRLRVLERMLGPAARVTRVEAESLTANTAWEDVDFAVVANVPAASFTPPAILGFAAAVESGLGVLVTGGDRSFGPGGYADTPLERIVPVRFQQKEERRDPSATLVIIIDTSGSMGGTRISLAKEVARLALKRLKPHDKAGIVEFHGAKRWAAPIQPAANAVDIQRALNRLNAGGGTVILPAIEESYYGMLNVRTRTRHLLVLTDGGVEQGAFEPLVRKMSQHGMTLSTVLVGPGTHSSFLVSLAQWGRGRYYHAPDRFNLPEVIVKQPESSLLSPAIEQPVPFKVVGDSFVRREIPIDDAPPVTGVLDVEAKPTADTLLQTARGEPLLVRWRYGLGQVTAWTTELAGPWTKDLAQWQGYAPLLAGLVREGARALQGDRVSVRASVEGGRVHVFPWRDATGGAAPIDLLIGESPRRFTVAPGSGRAAPFGTWAALAPGTARIQVVDERGGATLVGAAAIAPPREWSRFAPDRDRLAAWVSATGGRIDGGSTTVAKRTIETAIERWPAFLWTALIAFLLLVFVRRRTPNPVGAPSTAVGASLLWASIATCFVFGAGLAGGVGVLSAQPAASANAAANTAAPGDGPIDGPTDGQGVGDDVRALIVTARKGGAEGQAALMGAVRATRLAAGGLDPLVAYLTALSETTPDVAPLLARVAAMDGKPGLAEASLAALDKAGKLDDQGAMQYARLLETLGRDDDALKLLARAIEAARSPAVRIALEIRRASLWLSKEPTRARGLEAMKRLAAAAPKTGSGADYRFYLGYIAALQGDSTLLLTEPARTNDAKTHLRDLLILGTFRLWAGDNDDAKRQFGEAMRVATLVRDKRYAQERLIAAHRTDGTLHELCDAWIASPDRTVARVDALVALLRELKRPAEAFDLLFAGRGLENTAKKTRAFRSLQREIIGLALECGRPAEVEKIYRSLVKREPKRTEWWSGLALLYLLRGERERGATVFDEAVAAVTGEGKALIRLANAAHELALEKQAAAAAAAAIELGGAHELRAKLFLADRAFNRGEVKSAMALLRALEKSFAEEDTALVQVAEAYERYKKNDDAIRLLRKVQKRNATEDLLMRLAWLLQGQRKLEDAEKIWKTLWQTTKLPARIRQAEDRMLDLASNHGKLADLAIDLEEQLDEKKGGVRELRLLVKLYSRANDAVSAIEVLKAYGPHLGSGQVETLQNMAHVYQHCEDYRKYEETLLELQKIDPENAIDYQQQIAIGALERGRGRQAKRAIERLRRIAPNDLTADEFAAGVLSMVGLHEESVEAYTRVVTRFPNRIESYLLMANVMKDCGRRKQALYMFLDLMENAEKDDLFTIAVDGLLNLGAEPAVLRVACRRVRERIAQRPRKAFLYQLAADLAEELREPDEQVKMTATMALVAGDRRSAVLRELMDLESARGNYASMIDYGRSLLALGEEMPPQVFLDLGRALIRTNDLPTAERVFARTRIAGDFSSVQKQIAGYYEEAGYASAASRILRQTMLATPDDIELLAKVGALSEESGQFDQAQRDYIRAFDQLMERSPAVGTKSASRPRGGGFMFNRNRNTGPDAYKKHGNRVLAGLLSSTPPEDSTVVEALRSRLDREFKRLEADEAKKGFKPTLKMYPRLDRLHTATRAAALARGDHDEMDRVDEAILTHFPKDKGKVNAAIRLRVDRGSIAHAARLAERYNLSLPQQVTDANDVLSAKKADALLSPDVKAVKPADAHRYGRLLLAIGEVEKLRALLRRVDREEKMTAGLAQGLGQLAFALDERRMVRDFILRGVEAACAGAARGIENNLRQLFALGWGYLTMPERFALAERLRVLEKKADKKRGAAILAFRYRTAEALGVKIEADGKMFEGLLDATPKYLSAAADVLRAAPPGMRSSLFKRAVERSKRTTRSQFLALATSLGPAIDDDLAAEIGRAFRAAKKDPNYRAMTYGYSLTRLITKRGNPKLGREIAQHLGREFPDEGMFRLADALFAHQAGEADAIAQIEARLGALARRSKVQAYELQILQRILESADPKIRAVVERILAKERDAAGWARIATAALQFGGDLAATGARLKRMYESKPRDGSIRASYLGNLRQRGRVDEAAKILEGSLGGAVADNTYPFRQVAIDYRTAGRPMRALEAARRVKTRYVDNSLQQALLHELGRDEEAERLFLRTQAARRGGGFYVSGWQPRPLTSGGLARSSKGATGAGGVAVGRVGAVVFSSFNQRGAGALAAIVDQPWGPRILERQWRASLANPRVSVPLLGSVAAARWRTLGKKQALERLRVAMKAGDLDAESRALLWVAVKEFGASLENDLPGAMAASRRALLIERGLTSPSLKHWRRLLTEQGRADALIALDRYQITRKLVARGGFRFGQAAEAAFDDILAHVPDAHRAKTRRALLRQTAGVWFRNDNGNLEFALAHLEGWGMLGQAGEADRTRRLLERVLASQPEYMFQQAAALRARGAVALHWARLGDLARLRAALPGTRPSVRQLLPDPKMAGKSTNDAFLLMRALDEVFADRNPSRFRIALAGWLMEAGDRDGARKMIEPIDLDTLAAATANERLILADVARRLDDDALAFRIERDLLRERALNVMRIADHLAEIRRREGNDAFVAAAREAAEFTDYPAVLATAIRVEREAGRSAAVKALIARLAEVAPDDPAVKAAGGTPPRDG